MSTDTDIHHVVGDEVTEATLHIISEADKLNRWIYETIKPFCKGKILEIGCGIGNISSFFLRDDFEIMLTDLRPAYYAKLKESYKDKPTFLGAETMNLIDPDFEHKFRAHLGQYDTVFALNVVEHIKPDALAISNGKKLLKTGGHLIVLVPSYPSLYNRFDINLGHHRRYTKSSLSHLFLKKDLDVVHQQYFNFMGIFGWFYAGSVLKKESIPASHIRIYNFFVPLFKIIDRLIFNSAGLSTIIVGRKK